MRMHSLHSWASKLGSHLDVKQYGLHPADLSIMDVWRSAQMEAMQLLHICSSSGGTVADLSYAARRQTAALQGQSCRASQPRCSRPPGHLRLCTLS